VAAALVSGVRTFTPQHLANTLWAYATLDYQHPGMLKAAAAGGRWTRQRGACQMG
jgi:hypothetical protein